MNDDARTRRKAARSAFYLGALTVSLALGAILPADATVYTLKNKDDAVFGEDQTVTTVYEDTLYDLAAKYSLGSEEIIRVNPGIDPWVPGAGKQVIIPGRHILPPGPREGIVVNLPEHRLYYYPKPKRGEPQTVITYPVSIGKMDWRTPLGLTHVSASKRIRPGIHRNRSAKSTPPMGSAARRACPRAPTIRSGRIAMRLAAGNGTYLIHGTNNPDRRRSCPSRTAASACIPTTSQPCSRWFRWARRFGSSTSR